MNSLILYEFCSSSFASMIAFVPKDIIDPKNIHTVPNTILDSIRQFNPVIKDVKEIPIQKYKSSTLSTINLLKCVLGIFETMNFGNSNTSSIIIVKIIGKQSTVIRIMGSVNSLLIKNSCNPISKI